MSINNPNPESAGLTVFANEACESVGALASHYVPGSVLPSKEDVANLTEYFSRPVPVANFSSTTSQGVLLTLLGSYNSIISFFPNGANRLTGVFGLRFSVVYTLTSSATPFHQGVVVMSAQYSNASLNPAFWRRDNKFYACTNVPHTRLDLSNSTMAQLKIPFLDNIDFAVIPVAGGPATTDYYQFSVNQVLPTPLPATLTPANFQLYMHLEDIEFFGAVPQITSTVIPQSGAGIMSSEVEEASYPISSTVRSAAKTLKLASRAIPLLNPILSAPSWFVESTANALRSFGYSKTPIKDPIVRHVRQSTVNEHNVDQPVPVSVLGPVSTNSLAVDGQLGTNNVDEMALEYVLSTWGQIMYGTLSTSQAAGTCVYMNQVCPLTQWYKNSIGVPATASACPSNYQLPLNSTVSSNAFFPSTLMAVSQLFRFYRGGLQFRITFAKTKFHGGRVMLNFNPVSTVVVSTAPTFGGQANPSGMSMVFDLRDSNVVEFECPFVHFSPGIQCTFPFGVFTMTLVNALIATPSVSSTVDFLVEVRAAPGFDLSVPAGMQWPCGSKGATIGPVIGINLNAATIPILAASSTDDTVVPQSGITVTVPKAVSETFTHEHIKYTFGESIKSLKQLIMMPKLTNCGSVPTAGGDFINVPPWYYLNLSSTRAVPSANTFDSESFTTSGSIASWYSFVNGSTEGHFYTPGRPTNTCMVQWVGQAYSNYAATNDFRQTPAANVPRIIAVDDQPLHFVTPAYQRSKRIYPASVSNVAWIPKFGNAAKAPTLSGGFDTPWIIPRIRCFNNDTVLTLPGWLSRSAGEDARCACFLGPLPMLLPGAIVTGTYDPDSIVLD